eukprot:1001232-Prymnesium_polylepis.2
MLQQWGSKAPEVLIPSPSALKDPAETGCVGKLGWMLRKHASLMVRDPTLYLGRMAVLFLCARAARTPAVD